MQLTSIVHRLSTAYLQNIVYLQNTVYSKQSRDNAVIPGHVMPFCQYCRIKLLSNFAKKETISDSKSHAP